MFGVSQRDGNSQRSRLANWPNKPMVATATTRLASYSPDSLRRHIGQPLGGFEQRAAEEQVAGHNFR